VWNLWLGLAQMAVAFFMIVALTIWAFLEMLRYRKMVYTLRIKVAEQQNALAALNLTLDLLHRNRERHSLYYSQSHLNGKFQPNNCMN